MVLKKVIVWNVWFSRNFKRMSNEITLDSSTQEKSGMSLRIVQYIGIILHCGGIILRKTTIFKNESYCRLILIFDLFYWTNILINGWILKHGTQAVGLSIVIALSQILSPVSSYNFSIQKRLRSALWKRRSESPSNVFSN